MNYYSIEFFKHYLKIMQRQHSAKDLQGIEKTLKHMVNYIKDREENNKSAYSKKWMSKPVFK